LLVLLLVSFTCFFGITFVNPKDNALNISQNLKYDVFNGVFNNNVENEKIIKQYDAYNYLTFNSKYGAVDAIFYEDIKDKYNFDIDLSENECIVSTDFIEFLKGKNTRVRIGSKLQFDNVSGFRYNCEFKIKDIYDSHQLKFENKNVLIVSKKFYSSIKNLFGIIDNSINSNLNFFTDLNLKYSEYEACVSKLNFVKNYEDLNVIEASYLTENYEGYVHLGNYPTNENEIMVSNYYLYIALTNDRGNGFVYDNFFKDEDKFKYFGLDNKIEGKFFESLLDNGRVIDNVKVVGCFFLYKEYEIGDDSSIYLHKNLYNEIKSNVSNDNFNMFKSKSYYFDRNVIKDHYQDILDNNLILSIKPENIINYQIIKNLIVVSSVCFIILFLFRSIYENVLYDNINEDFMKLESLGAKKKDFIFILTSSSFMSFLVMIIGIIIGFMALKYILRMETSYFSTGSWVTKDVLVALCDILVSMFLLVLSYMPYLIKNKKKETKCQVLN
jgi:hypothetical protein